MTEENRQIVKKTIINFNEIRIVEKNKLHKKGIINNNHNKLMRLSCPWKANQGDSDVKLTGVLFGNRRRLFFFTNMKMKHEPRR